MNAPQGSGPTFLVARVHGFCLMCGAEAQQRLDCQPVDGERLCASLCQRCLSGLAVAISPERGPSIDAQASEALRRGDVVQVRFQVGVNGERFWSAQGHHGRSSTAPDWSEAVVLQADQSPDKSPA